MKIAYPKRHIRRDLIFALVWLTMAIVSYSPEKSFWITIGWAVISIAYFISFFYKKRTPSLMITNEVIKLGNPFRKEMKISEVKEVKKFAGDYIFKSENRDLNVPSDFFTPEEIKKLEDKLESLKLYK